MFGGIDSTYITALFAKLKSEGKEKLSELERELCILFWMNFDNYEIAQLANIELADVEMEREVIRQKLGIDEGTIQTYIQRSLN